jgi:hypothetical protein
MFHDGHFKEKRPFQTPMSYPLAAIGCESRSKLWCDVAEMSNYNFKHIYTIITQYNYYFFINLIENSLLKH